MREALQACGPRHWIAGKAALLRVDAILHTCASNEVTKAMNLTMYLATTEVLDEVLGALECFAEYADVSCQGLEWHCGQILTSVFLRLLESCCKTEAGRRLDNSDASRGELQAR